MNRVFGMFSRRKSDVSKEGSENLFSSRGSMSIRDLIAPSESTLEIKEEEEKVGDTVTLINGTTETLRKKRGRPRKDGKTIYSEYTRRYRRKTYVDTPEIRQRIFDLEKIIDLYDGSFRRSGRPRRCPLKATLTRKKIATLPPDIQMNCQEYLDLKRQLPPTKTLGRPRKNKDSASEQNAQIQTTLENQGTQQHHHNSLEIDQGTSLKSTSSIPNTTEYFERRSSKDTTPTVSKEVEIPNPKMSHDTEASVILQAVKTPNNNTISGHAETATIIIPKEEIALLQIPKEAGSLTTTIPSDSIPITVKSSIENIIKPKRKYRKRTLEEKLLPKIPRKRGRPRKIVNELEQMKLEIAKTKEEVIKKPPAKRGRPRKYPIEQTTVLKRSVGRPKKLKDTEDPLKVVPSLPLVPINGIAKNKRNSKNSRNARNAHLDPIQRLHYAIASDLKMRNKFKSHFKDCKNESVSWGFFKQETSVHVSKMYLLLLINPGLKDSVK